MRGYGEGGGELVGRLHIHNWVSVKFILILICIMYI